MKKTVLMMMIFSILIFQFAIAQTSVQDCVGAIPVCQSMYSETNSYTGTGNIIDYVGNSSCAIGLCVDPEVNSVWYTFQIQTTGVLDFRITPNGANTDYDWALFNLTNRNCSDLLNTSLYSQIIASCNSAYSYGTTGANTLTPNTNSNCQGPSTLNGAPVNNKTLNVTAGQIFYLNIQNWSGTTAGYDLDFTNSTASIYDNIPPTLDSVNSNIPCGATTITVTFSENVLCNTVDPTDFTLTGPNGTHTITGITGQVCSQGGNQENTYVMTISPPINSGGTYTLDLVGTITDLCGNIATSTSINFDVVQVICSVSSSIQPTCGASNGSATVTATQGSGNYTYEWSTTPLQTGLTASGLSAGSYTVTVHDGVCFSTCDVTLSSANGPVVTTSNTNSSCGLANGSASVSVTGNSPFTYAWSTNPTQTGANASSLAGGTYTVTVTDVANCTAVSQVVVGNSQALSLNTIKQNEKCQYRCDGQIEVQVLQGTAPYIYTWTGVNTTTSLAENLCSGNYLVQVKDSMNCIASASINITTNTIIHAGFNWSPPNNIAPANVTFIANSIGATNYFWDFGDGNNSNLSNPHNLYATPGSYTVQLIVNSGSPDNCSDTIEKTIVIYEPVEFIIPNVFTPNGDGYNDDFYVQSSGLKTEEMSIFNRWGRRVYKWSEIGGKWNGFNNGGNQEASDGVYFYMFKATSFDNTVYEKSGSVSLVR